MVLTILSYIGLALVAVLVGYLIAKKRFELYLKKQIKEYKTRYGVFDLPLVFSEEKISFTVTAEFDELARTDDDKEVKVRIRTFYVDNSDVSADPQKMVNIKKYLDYRWIETKKVKWFLEKNDRLDKLEKLLEKL